MTPQLLSDALKDGFFDQAGALELALSFADLCWDFWDRPGDVGPLPEAVEICPEGQVTDGQDARHLGSRVLAVNATALSITWLVCQALSISDACDCFLCVRGHLSVHVLDSDIGISKSRSCHDGLGHSNLLRLHEASWPCAAKVIFSMQLLGPAIAQGPCPTSSSSEPTFRACVRLLSAPSSCSNIAAANCVWNLQQG